MTLPLWAEKMKEIFLGGVTSQFIIYGNIFDFVSYETKDKNSYMSIRQFMTDIMFETFDVVLFYDRGKGILVKKGRDVFTKFLSMYDSFNGTSYASTPGLIPRDSHTSLELIGRFIMAGAQNVLVNQEEKKNLKMAIVIDYAQYVIPDASNLALSGELSENLIKIIDWAGDPAILGSVITTCLVTENLMDLNKAVSTNPYNAKIEIKLPNEKEALEYINFLIQEEKKINDFLEIKAEDAARRLTGLSRVNLRSIILDAVYNNKKITVEYLSKIKKELIEKECNGLLEFIESPYNLDMVAGHTEAKKWLRDDGTLIKNNKLESVPMGYLLAGRIGTGKTFLATSWAGEIGIPCVILKNFRDKWQGATEGNLEKIFSILRALGQVLVFIDEADQAAGKRESGEGDSGTSGRIYSMLAAQMSDTRNRGKIIWMFATSRPDLLEVDLKRQGRLDVHIPLFPPQNKEERNALFKMLAKKVKLDINYDELPELPENLEVAGNEMEGLLIRAKRIYELQGEDNKKSYKEILADIIKNFRPSMHTANLEYMDLIAVKECTDDNFLPEKYKKIKPAELEERIEKLKFQM